MFFWHKKKGTVFVGLSGGVDSAVSARLLQKEGYTVIGVFIRIMLPSYPCSAGEYRREALRVATHLKIPFREIDLSEAYAKKVFAPSLQSFAEGKTPNPDAWCNREIKFGLFYEYARTEGADYIATGHYALSLPYQDGRGLYIGLDSKKDQSYFLWTISEEQLQHTLFPVGGLQKEKVRQLAKLFSLPNAARKDSQGLCFIGNLSIEDVLKKEYMQIPGKVLNIAGKEIGEHSGAMLYTIGQRHGFDLFPDTPRMNPYFVIGKNISANTITVSSEKIPSGYSRTKISLTEEHWINSFPEGKKYLARFRYRQPLIPAEISKEDDRTVIVLTKPHGVPEGQSLVVYEGERCVGGGIVDKVELEA